MAYGDLWIFAQKSAGEGGSEGRNVLARHPPLQSAERMLESWARTLIYALKKLLSSLTVLCVLQEVSRRSRKDCAAKIQGKLLQTLVKAMPL